jgi:Flp pilus assembly protein TadG
MRQLLSRLRRDDRGISASEFALILPILVMFSAGTIEFSRLILLTQKLQSGSYLLADLTARDKELPTEQLANIFLAIDSVIQPFDFAANGHAIVTSVSGDPDDQPVLNWQCGGSGTLAATSQIVASDDTVTLPDDLPIAEGETIIAAEVFYDFEPLFGIGLPPRVIRRVAFFKPRLGDLTTMTCPA